MKGGLCGGGGGGCSGRVYGGGGAPVHRRALKQVMISFQQLLNFGI